MSIVGMGCRHDYVGGTTGVPHISDDLTRRPTRQPWADICASLHTCPIAQKTAASLFRRSHPASDPAPLRAYTRPRAAQAYQTRGALRGASRCVEPPAAGLQSYERN